MNEQSECSRVVWVVRTEWHGSMTKLAIFKHGQSEREQTSHDLVFMGLAMASNPSLAAKKLAKTAANKIKKAAVAAAKQAVAEQAVTEKARLSAIAKEEGDPDTNFEGEGTDTDTSVAYDPTAAENVDWADEEVIVPVPKKAKATKTTKPPTPKPGQSSKSLSLHAANLCMLALPSLHLLSLPTSVIAGSRVCHYPFASSVVHIVGGLHLSFLAVHTFRFWWFAPFVVTCLHFLPHVHPPCTPVLLRSHPRIPSRWVPCWTSACHDTKDLRLGGCAGTDA